MLALAVAMLVVFVINSQWGFILKSADDYNTRISAEKAAYISTFFLTNGPGYPSSWNATNVQIVGVAKNLDVIDSGKFIELMKIKNETLGELLGAPQYNIFINLTSLGGVTINSTGLRPVNYNISAGVLSFVSFNNTISKLYVAVWK